MTDTLPHIQWRWLPDSRLFYTEYPEYVLPTALNPPEKGDHIKNFIYTPETDSREDTPELQIPWSYEGEEDCEYQASPTDMTLLSKVCTKPGKTSTLALTRIDGSEVITVTERGGLGLWSPDGQQVLFGTSTDEKKDITDFFIWDIQTGKSSQVTHARRDYSYFNPVWSPNKQWIAFHREEEGVCVIRVATGDIICYPDYRIASGDKVTWSPDSRAIVFKALDPAAQLLSEGDLYIISVPDGYTTQLTNDPQQNERSPVWLKE